MRSWGVVHGLLLDLRTASRSLAANPTFTLTALITLALGIGANSALFTVVENLILRPLPFAGAERIVYLTEEHEKLGFGRWPTVSSIARWREQATSFDAFEVYHSDQRDMTGGREPLAVPVVAVSPSFSSSFGLVPILGRAFVAADAVPGGEPVALLSQGLWRQNFGSDPGVIGRRITLGDSSYTVVGVQPAGIRLFMSQTANAVWLPLAVRPGAESESDLGLSVIARRRPGVSMEQAQAELDVLGSAPVDGEPGDWVPRVVPVWMGLGRDFVTGVWMLLGAVGFVLLIACANVANMSLAKGVGRERELCIRVALGARRGRVMRMLLVESLFLSLAAGVAGLVLGQWTITLVGRAAADLPQLQGIAMDGRVLVFTLGVAVGVTLLFGLLPALHLGNANPRNAMGTQTRLARAGLPRSVLRQWIVGGEVALALVLLVGAGLMVKSFERLVHVDPGFDAESLGAFGLYLPERRYPTAAQQGEFLSEVLESVSSVPGVDEAVLAGGAPPRVGVRLSPPQIEGREPETRERRLISSEVWVSPGYFSTVGTPILAGRPFTDADRAIASDVMIINRAFASRYWPDEPAVGKRVRFAETERWASIIGVVGDVKALGLSDDPNRLQVYHILPDLETAHATVIVRSEVAFGDLLPLLRERVWALDPDMVIRDPGSLEASLSQTVARERMLAALFGLFALLALVLSAAGVYGVVTLSVNARIREVGVRVALGARAGQILRALVAQTAPAVALGVAIGVGTSLLLTRFMESLLFNVSPTDPVTFLTTALLLCGVAAVASYLPARRALRADPVAVLREE
jgi:putative ABC transport system permease protein